MDPIRNFVSSLEKSDISNGVNKRIIKKSICLVTVWVFLLSQFAYAGIYEDIFGLPSSQNMPSWEGSSGWRSSRVEPLYDPQQIEPILPLSNDEEGDSDGIWGWFKKHIIEPVVNFFTDESTQSTAKTVLETGVKIVLAPLLLFTACTAPPQGTPAPAPLPLPPTPTLTPATSTPIPTPTLSPELQKKITEYIDAFDSDNFRERMIAADELVEIGSPAVEPLIKVLLDEKTPSVTRRIAATTLGRIKDTRATEPLLPFLRDDSLSMRFTALFALEEIGDPRAAEATREARADDDLFFNPSIKDLNSPDQERRVNAAISLGYLKDPRAVEPLIQALQDEYFHMRYLTAIALGDIADPRAIAALEKVVANNDENENVRQAAEEALRKIRQK